MLRSVKSISTSRGITRAFLLLVCATWALCTFSHLLHVSAADAGAGGSPSTTASSAPLYETELIAIDLGHENMKIAAWRVQEEDVYIKAGGTGTVTTTTTAIAGAVSMVLNDQTNRKSPPCVAFRYFTSPAGQTTNETVMSEMDETLYPRGYHLERTFAEQAQALAPRFPTHVVCSPAQLLGYTAAAGAETDRAINTASPYELTRDQLTAAYSFHVQQPAAPEDDGGANRRALGVLVPFHSVDARTASSGSFFSAEELTGMLLGYARRMSEKADAADNALSEEEERQLLDMLNTTAFPDTLRTHAVPRYAALTIPVHATVAQRQAYVDAAALAGLRVVRLVHSTTGAAVQLAFMKAEQVFTADKTRYIMIYDMGSQQAEVAIYAFHTVPPKVSKQTRYEGAVELTALVGSRTLGGAAFDECVAAQWDALYFNHSVLTGVGRAVDEAERRSAAKQRSALLRAAHKAKETLSVNQEAHVSVDGVHADASLFSSDAQTQQERRVVSVSPDGLLSLRYSRAAFEHECRHLFQEAVELRDAAIAATNGLVANVGALDRFELIGGGTRVPLLIQQLSHGYRTEADVVDRTLNSDEAAVLGTTLLTVATAPRALQLRGGQSAPHYRVREWLTNTIYFSVDDGEAATPDDENTAKMVRMLFPAYTTKVPATRSVRVQVHDDGAAHGNATASAADRVTFTLYSGTELDGAYQARTSTDAEAAVDVPTSAAVCASSYTRVYAVQGIDRARAALLAQARREHPDCKVEVTAAEVVAEATVTVSGLPHVAVAYLRAEVRVTPASTTAAPTPIAEEMKQGREGVETLAEDDASPAASTTTTTTSTAAPAPGKEGEATNEDVEDTEEDENNNNNNTINEEQQRQHHVPDGEAAAKAFMVVKVMALPLRDAGPVRRLDSPVLSSYNMDKTERQRAHARLRRLQALDDVRLHRSTLRNDVESVLIWIKEQPAWEAEGGEGDGEKREQKEDALPLPEKWREVVTSTSEWLDDFGDTAGVAALEERLAAVRAIKKALRNRHSA